MAAQRGESTSSGREITDEEFLALFPKIGARRLAAKFGMAERSIYERRRRIEDRIRGKITPPTRGGHVQQLDRHPAAVNLGIEDGHILIGSDSHYWPGIVTTAHKAFLEFIREFKPKVIIKNGDEADFPSISRHAPIGWENRPTVKQEVDNLKAMLGEIEKLGKGSRFIWPLGNHDSRFETRLATQAPEYAKMEGVHLKDHFPTWEPCWACFVNKDVYITHRYKSGQNATRANTLNAGRTTITGHLHSMKVTPLSDLNGTRWGVDCGTMADPYGPQFYNYTELNPLDWRSGFVLLTFVKGRLLWPETIWVSGPDEVEFRGQVHRV
jgi:hypothetical protein